MDFTGRLGNIRDSIRSACIDAGRTPDAARLIAVSKTFPADSISGFYAAGQREFAENKVQELVSKTAVLPPDICWHMIGHLQSNKTAAAISNAAWIDSVDSVKLLRRIDRLAGEKGVSPVILLEVNLGGEENKTGASWDELPELAREAKNAVNCRWLGLMGMAPESDAECVRKCFMRLAEARLLLEKTLDVTLPELSMGMSGDFPVAVACGATMVRIGTALFGGRDYSL